MLVLHLRNIPDGVTVMVSGGNGSGDADCRRVKEPMDR